LQIQAKASSDLLKIDQLNANIAELGFNWIPGKTSVVDWFYSEKKQYWGENYNLLGYDYYTGGIYEAPGVVYATVLTNPYVDVWDWRNRHGANNPASAYYNGATGWLTSIKNQSDPAGCGSCSAFGTFGSFEAFINLYFNDNINYDLSEQEQLSCNPQIDCSDGHPTAIFPYIRDFGVVTESCFPYQANDQIDCDEKCENPDPLSSLTTFEEHTEGTFNWNSVQQMLITKGPLVWIKFLSGGTHAITLVGYIYDEEEDRLYLIQKESMGEDWGVNGNGILIEPAPMFYNYVGAALDATITSIDPPQQLLRDEDGDGLHNWGLGPKPPGASNLADCDDSNPAFTHFEPDTYSCHCASPVSSEIITIGWGEHVVWDTDFALNKKVIIENTGRLTITATIFVHYAVEFDVKPGGQLIIDGGTLTKACDDFWYGIEVWGDKTLSQLNPATPQHPYSNQGYLSVKNGGRIEYAKIGVLAGAVDGSGNFDKNKAGGVIHVDDAVFLNNKTGIKFLPYDDPNQYTSNLSSVSFTDFITHDEELMLFTPIAHIDLKEVYGIGITACNFSFQNNGAITPDVDSKGMGIMASDASFSIRPACNSSIAPCPTADIVPCTFTDLRYGVRAFSTGSDDLLYINNAIFDSCTVAIYLSGFNYPKITSNTININLSGSPSQGEFSGGIYLDGCTGYQIEDNEFYGNYWPQTLPSNTKIGLYIKDSGEEDNEIYNNSFNNLNLAIVAEGINRGGKTGLVIKCNDMFDNGNDIFVITNPDATGPLSYEGIKYMQGASSTQTEDLAGNTFTDWFDGTPAWGEYLWNYKNDIDHFDYFHHLAQTNPLTHPLEDNYTDVTITLDEINIPFIKSTACPSHIGGGGTSQSRMSTAETNISTYDTQLADLTDGGDTDGTNDSITFSLPSEGLALRDQLLDNSPYLSDTVMQSAIAKEDVLPNAMLRDVLVANPQSAKSDEIMDAADSRSDPMPGYMLNEIMEGLDEVGAKELLESKVGHWNNEYKRAFNDLARAYFADTLNTDPRNSLIALLENEDELQCKYSLAMTWLDKRDTTVAIDIIDGIPADFELNTYQSEVQEAYEDYFDVMETMYNNSLGASEIDSTNVQILSGIMDAHLPRVSAYATGLLVKGGHIDFTERIALPGEFKASRVYPDDRPPFEDIEASSLKLMPNPAKNYVVIDYDLGLAKGQGIILIRDAKGVLVKNLGLHQVANQITVELNDIPAGMYIVSLYAGNKHIESRQLSVTH
ncbi:MAG: hypothetical protein DRJ05_10300, partial [Bacteroidetes bacterium]